MIRNITLHKYRGESDSIYSDHNAVVVKYIVRCLKYFLSCTIKKKRNVLKHTK